MGSKALYRGTKRLIDLVVAGLALVVLFPLLLSLAMWIRRDGGPALYGGDRVGRHGKPFRMLKFRTMVVDADKVGPSSTPDDDPRLTSIGRRLRSHKVDELPQLLNVFAGSMSLVGPRPQVAHDVALYSEAERALLAVRPGITDYASIRYRNEGEILRGSADPAAAYVRLIRAEKIRLGLEYVRTQSLRVDLKILMLTFIALFSQEAAVRRLPENDPVGW